MIVADVVGEKIRITAPDLPMCHWIRKLDQAVVETFKTACPLLFLVDPSAERILTISNNRFDRARRAIINPTLILWNLHKRGCTFRRPLPLEATLVFKISFQKLCNPFDVSIDNIGYFLFGTWRHCGFIERAKVNNFLFLLFCQLLAGLSGVFSIYQTR